MREEAFYFPSQGKRLFGFLHEPEGAKAGNCPAMVFCHPHPVEKEITHRGLVSYARALAQEGFVVLRFDLFGTGDSEGDLEDANLEHWLGDIATACAWLRERCAPCKFGVLGLRLGATLAVLSAERTPRAFDFLVLWSPVVQGRNYLERMLRQQAVSQAHRGLRGQQGEAREGRGEANGGVEVMGLRISRDQCQELQRIDLNVAKRYDGPVLVVHFARNRPEESGLAALAKSYPVATAWKTVTEPVPWLPLEMWHYHGHATELYEQSSAWLEQMVMAGDGRGSLIRA